MSAFVLVYDNGPEEGEADGALSVAVVEYDNRIMHPVIGHPLPEEYGPVSGINHPIVALVWQERTTGARVRGAIDTLCSLGGDDCSIRPLFDEYTSDVWQAAVLAVAPQVDLAYCLLQDALNEAAEFGGSRDTVRQNLQEALKLLGPTAAAVDSLRGRMNRKKRVLESG